MNKLDILNLECSDSDRDLHILISSLVYLEKMTIPSLAETLVASGFSNHTLDATAPVCAVTLGAKDIEKYFISDKSIGGADADFSLSKKEFAEMMRAVIDTVKLLGKVDYSMTEKKEKSRQFSRSLYVGKDIKKGKL